jgi:hypothetical protein
MNNFGEAITHVEWDVFLTVSGTVLSANISYAAL